MMRYVDLLKKFHASIPNNAKTICGMPRRLANSQTRLLVIIRKYVQNPIWYARPPFFQVFLLRCVLRLVDMGQYTSMRR